jgi:hypothetical protein
MIIGWGVAIFPYMQQSVATTVVLMTAAVVLTHWVTRGWLALVTGITNKKSNLNT